MWQKYCGHDTPNQSLTRIDYLPATLKLIAIACLLEHVPGLVGSNILQPSQDVFRNFRPTVRKSVSVPGGSKLNPLFAGKYSQLGLRGWNPKGDCKHQYCPKRFLHGSSLVNFQNSQTIAAENTIGSQSQQCSFGGRDVDSAQPLLVRICRQGDINL